MNVVDSARCPAQAVVGLLRRDTRDAEQFESAALATQNGNGRGGHAEKRSKEADDGVIGLSIDRRSCNAEAPCAAVVHQSGTGVPARRRHHFHCDRAVRNLRHCAQP